MKTEQILTFLRIGAWVLFIGAIVRTVLLAVVFVTRTDWTSLDLPPSGWLATILLFSLWLAVALLHVRLWEKVKNILMEINLGSPFTMHMANRFLRTSYALLAIWVVSFIGKSYLHFVQQRIPGAENILAGFDYDLIGFNAEVVYLLNAGIVYIIAQVFRRGVELQQENELTI